VALKNKKSGASASSLKLCSLTPTSDVFIKNVHKGQMQVAVWKVAIQESLPNMDPTRYGWELDHECIVQPWTVSSGRLSAPPEIVQLIWCSCCKIACTIFCVCEGGQACENPLTQRSSVLEASDMVSHETMRTNGSTWLYCSYNFHYKFQVQIIWFLLFIL